MRFHYVIIYVFFYTACHSGDGGEMPTPVSILRFDNAKINDPLVNPFQILVIEGETYLLVMHENKIIIYKEFGQYDTVNIPKAVIPSYFFALNKDSMFLFSKNDRSVYFYDVLKNSIFSVYELPIDSIEDKVIEYRFQNAVSTRPYNIHYGYIGLPLSYYSKNWEVGDYVDYRSKSPTHLLLNLKHADKSLFLGFLPQWCSNVNKAIKSNAWNGLEYSSVILPIDENKFIFMHVFSDTLHVLDSRSGVVESHIIKSRFVKMPPPTFLDSNLEYREYARVTPKYRRIIFDDDKNILYIICEHGTFSDPDFKVQGNSNWSIIKYNILNKNLKEYYFEGGYYNYSDIHLYRDGLLISNKGYKNISYDNKSHSYTYFKFN